MQNILTQADPLLDLFLFILYQLPPNQRVLEVAGRNPIGIFPDEFLGGNLLAKAVVVDEGFPVDVVGELIDDLWSEAAIFRELFPVPVVLELLQQFSRDVLLLNGS